METRQLLHFKLIVAHEATSTTHNEFIDRTKKLSKDLVVKGKYSAFYCIIDTNHHFSQIQLVVCSCFQFGTIQNFDVW